VAGNLTEVMVAADTYQVSPRPVLLTADLCAALAVCMHDERRAVGGLLHLPSSGAGASPKDLTDNTLSCVLIVLERFKRAVLGNAPRGDEVRVRIIAHAPPSADPDLPSASLADLIKADLADAGFGCGTRVLPCAQPVRVHFEPFTGRVWLAGADDGKAGTFKRSHL